jgi:hypothetical protein
MYITSTFFGHLCDKYFYSSEWSTFTICAYIKYQTVFCFYNLFLLFIEYNDIPWINKYRIQKHKISNIINTIYVIIILSIELFWSCFCSFINSIIINNYRTNNSIYFMWRFSLFLDTLFISYMLVIQIYSNYLLVLFLF